jgi:hypothetical protein
MASGTPPSIKQLLRLYQGSIKGRLRVYCGQERLASGTPSSHTQAPSSQPYTHTPQPPPPPAAAAAVAAAAAAAAQVAGLERSTPGSPREGLQGLQGLQV